MTTLLLTHPACLLHDTGYGHPERADRLRAIDDALAATAFKTLKREEAPRADLAAIERLHPKAYVEMIRASIPAQGHKMLDADTVVSPGSWEAALRATGACIYAVDQVMAGKADNAFCAVRPPGHHAEPSRAMGFCLFNSVAVAALHARAAHGAKRVAVVDFDVHHGNGTQDLLWDDPRALFVSSHQMPLYPGTGHPDECGAHGQILNLPLRPGTGGAAMRAAWESAFPRIAAHAPELILISAGFDAHRDDPLASLLWTEEDFRWLTSRICELADTHCAGRVVSALEGGYDLPALAASTAAHVDVLRTRGR